MNQQNCINNSNNSTYCQQQSIPNYLNFRPTSFIGKQCSFGPDGTTFCRNKFQVNDASFTPTSMFERECLNNPSRNNTFCRFISESKVQPLNTYVPQGINSMMFPDSLQNINQDDIRKLRPQNNTPPKTQIITYSPDYSDIAAENLSYNHLIESIATNNNISENPDGTVYLTNDGHVIYSKQTHNEFKLVNEIKEKNFTYDTFTIHSRISEFNYALNKELYNIIDYQILAFHSPVNVPIINEENNKMIIVDNMFTDEITERTITVPDLWFPQPLYGSERTEVEQLELMFRGIIELTQQLEILLNTQGTNVYFTNASSFQANGSTQPNATLNYLYQIDNDPHTNPTTITTPYYDIVWENVRIPLKDPFKWIEYFSLPPSQRPTHQLQKPDDTYFNIDPDTTQGYTHFINWKNHQNWKCRIVIQNPGDKRFYLKPSSLLEQLGIYAFDTPATESQIGTFNNFENTYKTLAIFINDVENPAKTLYFPNSIKQISFETEFEDPKHKVNNKRLQYDTYPKTQNLHIKLTVGDYIDPLFNFYNNSLHMTISVMYEITDVR